MAALRARNLIAAAGLIAVAAVAACSSPSSTSSATNVAPGASPDPALWGAMKPIVSVKELMHNLIDPVADNVFDSVAIIVDRTKTVDIQPKTQDDWDKVAIGGTMLAEASYLLKVKRPFAPAGEKETPGAEEVELTPEEMMAKVQKDPVEWNARIEALRNVGLQVLDIVKRKDVQELWDAADNLEMACENCHRSFWYPGETSAYYSRLDKRLRDHSLAGPSAPAPEKSAPAPKRPNSTR
ncbi:MAG TPA: hypothetical protein VH417_10085 [Vicinamibacterales bacterium]|jgi:hypothetical protein